MREIVLATAFLLSMVASEKFENKKRYATLSTFDQNFWPVRGKRSPWETDFRSSYLDGGKTYREVAKPRFPFQDSLQHPPVAKLRYATGVDEQPRLWANNPNQDLRPDYSYWNLPICRSEPSALPYDYYKFYDDSVACDRPRCVSRRGRRENNRWGRPQPIYVEEPTWVEIDPNHDSLRHSSEDGDPFFVARGKKYYYPSMIDNSGTSDPVDMTNNYNFDPLLITREKRETPSTIQENGMNLEHKKLSSPTFSKMDEKQLLVPSVMRPIAQDYSVQFDPKTEEAQEKKEFQAIKSYLNNRISYAAEVDTEENAVDAQLHDRSDVSTSLGGSHSILREKRSTDVKNSVSIASTDKSQDVQPDGDHHGSVRRQRSILSDTVEDPIEKWLGNTDDEKEPTDSKDLNYMNPRNKHSTLLDILEEPFFISRGKKSTPERSHSEIRNSVALEIGNPEREGQLLDAISDLPYLLRGRKPDFNMLHVLESLARHGNRKYNYGGDLNLLENIAEYDIARDETINPNLSRSRRGMLDDLLSQNKPFHVARGKRFSNRKSSSISHYSFKNNNDSTSSEFSKSMEKKLLRNLANYSRTRSIIHPGGRIPQSRLGLWNFNDGDKINDQPKRMDVGSALSGKDVFFRNKDKNYDNIAVPHDYLGNMYDLDQ